MGHSKTFLYLLESNFILKLTYDTADSALLLACSQGHLNTVKILQHNLSLKHINKKWI